MVGESFETSPENIDNPASDNSVEVVQGTENQTREVEPQKLKAIYEKCTKIPDEKEHKSPRLGVDVVLEDEELKEVKVLEGSAREQLKDLTRDNPLWYKFISLEREGVRKDILQGIGKYGTTQKDHHVSIIESSDTVDVTKALHESGRAAIKVPPEIANLIRQRNRLDDLGRVHSIPREDVSASNFGRNLKEVYRFYKEHTDNVGSRASEMKGEIIGEGSNATAYEVKEDPNLVLLEEGKKFGHSRQEQSLASVLEIKNLLDSVPAEVNTPRILEAWIEGNLVCTLMERAKGQVLHQMRPSFDEWGERLEILADAPQSDYDKLISDSEKLHEAGLNIDPRPTNFLYDRETGFHFIDLDKLEAHHSKTSFDVPFINTGTLFNSGYSDRFPQIRGFVLEILSKLEKAGYQGDPERIASIRDKLGSSTEQTGGN